MILMLHDYKYCINKYLKFRYPVTDVEHDVTTSEMSRKMSRHCNNRNNKLKVKCRKEITQGIC